MNEEILLRLGFDASAVKRGTMAMMDQQKKSASDYVSFWKKAIGEREQAEIQADVRSASRSNRARMLWRQRTQERTEAWKKELAAQRGAMATTREARNVSGVNLANLARNVVGGRGRVGHGGMNSGALGEGMVLARELSSGNISGAVRSTTVLAQRMGMLGRVVTALVNPITVAIAGLAGGAAALYKIGYGARQTIAKSGDVGFSTTGYQTLLRQASRESGGAEGAQSAMETLSQNVGALRQGDLGQMRKFRKYGVATTGPNGGNLSNEQIFTNILGKYEATGDPAKRAAMAMDMFGESYKRFVKTLNEGQGGFQAAMGKGVQSPGKLAAWSALGGLIGDSASGVGNFLKRGTSSAGNGALSGLMSIMQKGHGPLTDVLKTFDREGARSAELDKREQELIAAGKIKPSRMTQKEFQRLHPELASDLKIGGMRQQDAQNELEDRGKVSLSDLASMGRRLTGHILPRQYTVTPRMRTAMKVEDLDARANISFMRGDDAGMKRFKGEADQMRKANPWLAAMDRDPTRKMTEQLEQANKALKDIQDMANFVMTER